jgi:hypothetical protein
VIAASLAAENENMLKAFNGVYLIQVDIDEWEWSKQPKSDFDFEGIPIFYKLDSEGKPTGETIDGSAWGKNDSDRIAPVLDAFFHDS